VNWNHSHLGSQPLVKTSAHSELLLSRALCADLPGGCGLLELSGAPVHRSQGSRRLPDRLTTAHAHFLTGRWRLGRCVDGLRKLDFPSGFWGP
jgi:hypothetical protein